VFWRWGPSLAEGQGRGRGYPAFCAALRSLRPSPSADAAPRSTRATCSHRLTRSPPDVPAPL
jgi:hypothetical protein